jgi:Nitrile hydratase, alpha chain
MGNQIKSYEELFERVRTDEKFKQRFLKEPKIVLSEMGMKIPDSVEIEIHEDMPTLKHLVIPADTSSDRLSESELMMIAGGSGYVGISSE